MTHSTHLTRILHLENDEDVIYVASIALSEIGGLEVRHCATASEALQAIDTFEPQLLLLDYTMPSCSGPEFWQRFRSIPGYESIPAIYLTARAESAVSEELFGLGALDVITKPFDVIGIAERLRRAWDRYTDQTLGSALDFAVSASRSRPVLN